MTSDGQEHQVGRDRRDGERQPSGAPPSGYAARRLGEELRREVADLRVRLQETTLRSDAYLAAGYPEAAAEVVAEQRQLIARFHARVDRSTAAASVEAEAERVLAAAPGSAEFELAPAGRPRVGPPTAATMRSALAALALAALAVVATPQPDTRLSSADGQATDAVALATPSAHQADTGTRTGAPDISAEPGLSPDAAGPSPQAAGGGPHHGRSTTDAGGAAVAGGLLGIVDGAVGEAVRALLALRDPGGPALTERTDDEEDQERTTGQPATTSEDADRTDEPGQAEEAGSASDEPEDSQESQDPHDSQDSQDSGLAPLTVPDAPDGGAGSEPSDAG